MLCRVQAEETMQDMTLRLIRSSSMKLVCAKRAG